MPPPMRKNRSNKRSKHGQTRCFSDFPKPIAMELTRLLPLDAFAPIATKLTVRITRASGLTGNIHIKERTTSNDEKKGENNTTTTTNIDDNKNHKDRDIDIDIDIDSNGTKEIKNVVAERGENVKEETKDDAHAVQKKKKTYSKEVQKTIDNNKMYSCEVRLNGRSLVRSKRQRGKRGDPYWNEKHEVWIDKRVDLSLSKITIWVDYHSLEESKTIPLGVVTFHSELIKSMISSSSVQSDKSRPLRQYTGRKTLGDKTGGSVMVGFSINDENNDNNDHNVNNYDSNCKDELDNLITNEVRTLNKKKEIYGSASNSRSTGGTIGKEELYRLNRLKRLKHNDQLNILKMMKKLLLETKETNFDGGSHVGMTLPPICVAIPKKANNSSRRKAVNDAIQKSKTIQLSTFCKIFDQAVVRCAIKGSAPPKLIMRSFVGEIRTILLKIHHRSSLEGCNIEFVSRMLNLEDSGELLKMITEMLETMKEGDEIESGDTAMSMLISAIPKFEKKLEQKKRKTRKNGQRIQKFEIEEDGAMGKKVLSSPRKGKLSTVHEEKKRKKRRNVKKKDVKQVAEFIDDEGNVYRCVGKANEYGSDGDNEDEEEQEEKEDHKETDDYYYDEEFKTNLEFVMNEDDDQLTQQLVPAAAELNYVSHFHESHFQPTLPTEEFSGVMVYNNGVPTQTYQENEMDPDLLNTLFEFRGRRSNNEQLMDLTMKELQSSIPIITEGKAAATTMNSYNSNMAFSPNSTPPNGYPPNGGHPPNGIPAMGIMMTPEVQQHLESIAGRINHSETTLSSNFFPAPNAEFSGVVVYDRGREIETYEESSYFHPSNKVDEKRTLQLAKMNEQNKNNTNFDDRGSLLPTSIMKQYELPTYMNNDVTTMIPGSIPNDDYDEEEDDDDPYYGPYN